METLGNYLASMIAIQYLIRAWKILLNRKTSFMYN